MFDLSLALTDIPLWYLVLVVFCFGVIIGSFLNVFIYRFHTGKSLSGSSHCLSCQTPLHWYELFPLLSYVVLRGRCRTCSSYIPSRYFWVELTTGILFVWAVLATPPVFWPWAMFLVALIVIITVYDLYHLVIPDVFVLVFLGAALFPLGWAVYEVLSFAPLFDAVLGALVGYGFFYALWKYSNGRWIGYGDAKLAIPCGLILGLSGTFSMLVLSFWIGAFISLSILAYQAVKRRGQRRLPFAGEPLTMKSEVPFAPFLLAGFLTVWLGGAEVLTLVSYVLPTPY